jgi:hypothetical protein
MRTLAQVCAHFLSFSPDTTRLLRNTRPCYTNLKTEEGKNGRRAAEASVRLLLCAHIEHTLFWLGLIVAVIGPLKVLP